MSALLVVGVVVLRLNIAPSTATGFDERIGLAREERKVVFKQSEIFCCEREQVDERIKAINDLHRVTTRLGDRNLRVPDGKRFERFFVNSNRLCLKSAQAFHFCRVA